ncbi:MAG: hypothetical protein HY939_07990 [Gammaproteobacteria bacterium]|nr:hypothetical protein [Gammaproteobacteria bacterium]
MRPSHSGSDAIQPFYDEEFLGEIDIFEDNRESLEEKQRRKARLDALEEKRQAQSLRKQIDYLYDREFVNLNSQTRGKRSNKDTF